MSTMFESPLDDTRPAREAAANALFIPLIATFLLAAFMMLIVDRIYPSAFNLALGRALPWLPFACLPVLPLLHWRWRAYRHRTPLVAGARDVVAPVYWIAGGLFFVPFTLGILLATLLVLQNGRGPQTVQRLQGTVVGTSGGRSGPTCLVVRLADGETVSLKVTSDVLRDAKPGQGYSETVRKGSLGIIYQFAYDGALSRR